MCKSQLTSYGPKHASQVPFHPPFSAYLWKPCLSCSSVAMLKNSVVIPGYLDSKWFRSYTQRGNLKLFQHQHWHIINSKHFHCTTSLIKCGYLKVSLHYKKLNIFIVQQTSVGLCQSCEQAFRLANLLHNGTVLKLTTVQYISSLALGGSRGAMKKANLHYHWSCIRLSCWNCLLCCQSLND